MRLRIKRSAFEPSTVIPAVAKMIIELDTGEPVLVLSEAGGHLLVLKAGEKGFADTIRAAGGIPPEVEVYDKEGIVAPG